MSIYVLQVKTATSCGSFALQDINKPIGVAEYQLLLPKEALQNLLLSEMKAMEQEKDEMGF